jgi:hypothetical protein
MIQHLGGILIYILVRGLRIFPFEAYVSVVYITEA